MKQYIHVDSSTDVSKEIWKKIKDFLVKEGFEIEFYDSNHIRKKLLVSKEVKEEKTETKKSIVIPVYDIATERDNFCEDIK